MGNQPSYQSKTVIVGGEEVLLVCVPVFDHTHSGVLVNLGTLRCTEVSCCGIQVGDAHISAEAEDCSLQEENVTVLEEMESEGEL